MFNKGLGDKEAIERVFVVKRHGEKPVGVADFNREDLKAAIFDSAFPKIFRWMSITQL